MIAQTAVSVRTNRCPAYSVIEGNLFFERPIANSPYEYPRQHWELDESGQPTGAAP